MVWFAMETIDVYMPPGKHTVTNSDVVTQGLHGDWPIQEMNRDEFFVAYRVHSGLSITNATGHEEQYFSGLWV